MTTPQRTPGVVANNSQGVKFDPNIDQHADKSTNKPKIVGPRKCGRPFNVHESEYKVARKVVQEDHVDDGTV